MKKLICAFSIFLTLSIQTYAQAFYICDNCNDTCEQTDCHFTWIDAAGNEGGSQTGSQSILQGAVFPITVTATGAVAGTYTFTVFEEGTSITCTYPTTPAGTIIIDQAACPILSGSSIVIQLTVSTEGCPGKTCVTAIEACNTPIIGCVLQPSGCQKNLTPGFEINLNK